MRWADFPAEPIKEGRQDFLLVGRVTVSTPPLAVVSGGEGGVLVFAFLTASEATLGYGESGAM